MSIFDGMFGSIGALGYDAERQRRQLGNRQPSGGENSQMWQQALAGQPVPYLQYNPAQGIPIQYFAGLANNRQVTCAYCRTERESRHKTCTGCGASEVLT